LLFGAFGPVERVAQLLLVFCGIVINCHITHHVDVVHRGFARAAAFKVFGGRSECAEVCVLDDVFDGRDGLLSGLRFGQVEAGDLEAVEQETGAAGIDVIGGDALEDFADGELNGATVFRNGQVKGAAALLAGDRVGNRFAGPVVVIAKVFVAERWTGAAVPVGEDVAALEAYCGAGI